MIFLTDIDNTIRVGSNMPGDTVSATIAVNGSTLLSGVPGRLSSGYYYFYGVQETLQAYMELNNLTVVPVTVTYAAYNGTTAISVAGHSLSVLYKSVNFLNAGTLTADVLTSSRFLTPQKSAILFAGGTFRLPLYISGSAYPYVITYTRRNGTTKNVTALLEGTGVNSIVINYNAEYSQAHVVTLDYGTFDVFFVDIPAVEFFQFRNVFNALENFAIPASTVSSPKTEFETARQGNVTKRYDVEHGLEFTIKTAALPASIYPALLSLCRSRSVSRLMTFVSGGVTYSRYADVIIKEYKFDRSNNPNSEIALEMKLEYADRAENDAVEIE